MENIRPRAALVAVVAGVSLTLAAGPALADATDVFDPSGDVVEFDGDAVDVGDLGDMDLRNVRVDHRTDNVTVTARFTNLVEDSWTSSFIRFDTNGDNLVDRSVIYLKTGAPGVYTVDADGRQTSGIVPCQGPAAAEQFGFGGSVTFVVPRSCIGSPAQVAVNFQAAWFGTSTSGNELSYLDGAPGEFTDRPLAVSAQIPVERIAVIPAPAVPQVDSAITVSAKSKTQKFGGKPLVLKIRSAARAAGTVVVRDGSRRLGSRAVGAGQVLSYKLPKRLKAGKHRIVVSFAPADGSRFLASSKAITIRVKR